ncbi:MAG: YceI family protein [Bacteroidales bacterium]
MKKILFVLAVIVLASISAEAQKYITKTGKIRFFSDAPMEKIEAVNNQVNAALDIATGDMVFKVLIKSFVFEKALMQEHFNENYMESDKFPNSTFKGKVTNISEMDFSKDGKYNAQVEGTLTIHGVSQPIKTTGVLESKNGKIHGTSVFTIKVRDYDIKIPSAVVKNIAETLEITVDVILEKLDK